jgi:radical SAM superfamily enzyme YgiQ (UPF0313 family)
MLRMKICLIRPSIVVPANNQTTMFTPPLGLAYVAGTLREAGFDVTAIDALGESLDTRHPVENDCFLYGLTSAQVVARIPTDTAMIGIHFGFSFEWPYSRRLAQIVRAAFPRALLVGGGEHVTAVPAESLKEGPLDVIVLGEGEETIVEIAKIARAGQRDLSRVCGIAYTNLDGRVVVNPRRPRVRDIDAIARPAWDLFPIRNYLDAGVGFGVNRGRSMPVLASRGCPYQCTFCSSPAMWTTRWIARDPDKLLDEMEHYQAAYGAQNFDFYDLTAIVKKSWIVAFCRKIRERGLSFTWQLPSGTRSEAIDSDAARLLYDSGCRNLSYSPESGSPEVLARIKKRIHVDAVVESIAACRRESINVKCNVILGFPGETLRHVWQSYRFIARMAAAGAYDISVWAFSPYPGSELFAEIAKRQNLVLDDVYYDSLRSYADSGRTVSYSEYFSDRQLKILRFAGAALFYAVQWARRPWRPLRLAFNLLRGREESRSEMALLGMIRRRQLKVGPSFESPPAQPRPREISAFETVPEPKRLATLARSSYDVA